MEIIHTGDFEKLITKLPTNIKLLCLSQERIFVNNWRDTRLHLKKIKDLEQVFLFVLLESIWSCFIFKIKTGQYFLKLTIVKIFIDRFTKQSVFFKIQ